MSAPDAPVSYIPVPYIPAPHIPAPHAPGPHTPGSHTLVFSAPPLDPRRPKGRWLRWPSAVSWSGAAVALVFGLAVGAFPLQAEAEAEAEAVAEAEGGVTKTSLESQIKERLAEMPSGEEGINQILSQLDERLSLSAEQKKDVREVVAQGVAELEKLSARFKSGELTAMALGLQVQMKMQKMAFLIEPLLDHDQQKEYGVMRQEQRREMMQAMRKQRTQPVGAK